MVFEAAGMQMDIDPKLNNLDNEKPISKLTKPILFVHGVKDDFIPKFMSEKLFEISPSKSKKILLVENAGHNDIFKTEHLNEIIKETIKL